MPCYLSIQNPLVLKARGVPASDLEEYQALYSQYVAISRETEDHERITKLGKKVKTFHDFLLELNHDPFNRLLSEILPYLPADADPRTKHDYTGAVMKVQAHLMSQGFDGIHMVGTLADMGSRNHQPTDWWIAFRPNQIKSAIGNSGKFQMGSDSITEAADQAGSPADQMENAFWDAFDASERQGARLTARPRARSGGN
jgi:hypothetical protein